jgi:hypothetical protein
MKYDINKIIKIHDFLHEKKGERIVERKIIDELFEDFMDDEKTSKFFEKVEDYDQFVVYDDVGVLCGSAGVKTEDGKYNMTVIRA